MLRSKEIAVLLTSGSTLPDAYYAMVLPVLTAAIGICKQAGLAIPPQNDTKATDDIELEGIFFALGPGREFSCRAARYNDAGHKTDAGIVVSEKTGGLDGRARISILYEVLHEPVVQRKWSLYAQVLPGCRTEQMKTLCERLEIDWTKETKKEISEDDGLCKFLTAAQWRPRSSPLAVLGRDKQRRIERQAAGTETPTAFSFYTISNNELIQQQTVIVFFPLQSFMRSHKRL